MMRIIAAQARALPTVSLRPEASEDAAATAWDDFAEDTDAVVVVIAGPPSVQVRLARTSHAVLQNRDRRQDEQQPHHHGGGVSELEAPEGHVVDVVLQHECIYSHCDTFFAYIP